MTDVLNLYFKARFEECSALVKKQKGDGSPNESGEMEEEDEEAGVPGNRSGEDDDMESVPSSGRTSMIIDDTESSRSPDKGAPADDDDSAHRMEGIDGSSWSDTKPGVGAAIEELVELAGEPWVKEVGSTVRHLRELGYTSLSEEGYSSAIYSVLKVCFQPTVALVLRNLSACWILQFPNHSNILKEERDIITRSYATLAQLK